MAAPSAQICPRCAQPLERAEVRKVGLETCTQCKGLLVAQATLSPLLSAMSVDLLKNFDPDVEIAPLKDAGGPAACPNCRNPMQNDNYCGAGIVFFDRCESCALLWLDSQELGAMTMMWTRMDGRRIRDRNEHDEALRSLAQVNQYRRDYSLLGASVADIILSGLIRF